MHTGGAPPPVKSKPVFSTTTSSSSFNPIVAARNASLRQKDDDGWGDAPQVSRSEIQKVESAYKPTKVNMAELTSQRQEPSRFNGSSQQDDRPRDVIGGGYQPVGKVDIAAIRAAAREKKDDRPTPVKGSYEPVGKVDIAAIRAKAQKPADSEPEPEAEQPKSLAERSAAFHQAERITELPKPKVAKKWGGASTFTGTKAPTPTAAGLGSPSPAAGAPPVGSASRTFADQGGKTPAQIWAEKKAQQGGGSAAGKPATSPVTAQKSGGAGWQSGYTGKSWAPVNPAGYSRGLSGQKTGETETSQEPPASPAGSVGALRDRFKEAQPIAARAPSAPKIPSPADENDRAPPPPPLASRPSDGAPTGGFALPGMPPRPPPVTDEEEEPERDTSPIRMAVPVPRGPEPEFEPAQEPPRSLPVRQIEQELPREEDLPREEEAYDPRAAATAVAESQFGHAPVAEAAAASSGGRRALIQYDYEKAEDNELELREGEYVTNIEMVDEDWWMGTNSQGESGLFPSNYVELVEDEAEEAPPAPAPAPAAGHAAPPPPPAAEPEAATGQTATAQYDYEAAEDNGKQPYPKLIYPR